MVGYFNGHYQTVWVMVQGLIQTLLVRLPLSYYMSIQPHANLTNIGLAAPIATIVGIILNVCFYIYLSKKMKIGSKMIFIIAPITIAFMANAGLPSARIILFITFNNK